MISVLKKHPRLCLTIDTLIGLRACGVYLYGVLPATLFLLGNLEIKDIKIDLSSKWYYLVISSLIPLTALYVLIRKKHENWYLSLEHLNLRAAIVTTVLLMSSWTICGVSGLLNGKYYLVERLEDINSGMMVEPFLFAIVSLAISSTLFMSIITEDSELPGLPTKQFIDKSCEIRKNLIILNRNDIWKKYDKQKIMECKKTIDSILSLIEDAFSTHSNNFGKIHLKQIQQHLKKVRLAFEDETESEWKVLLDEDELLTAIERNSRVKRQDEIQSIKELKSLKLGDRSI